MSLRVKPHTIVVYQLEQSGVEVDNTILVNGRTYSALGEVACQVTPERAMGAYESFGITAKDPHLVMMDPVEGDLEDWIKVGNLFTYRDSYFSIVSSPQTFRNPGSAQHTSFLAEKLQYAPS